MRKRAEATPALTMLDLVVDMTILREEEGQDVPKPLQKFRSEYGHGE
jgi:hypothetical protein